MSVQQRPDYYSERRSLVEQIEREGIRHANVLSALSQIPREEFLPPNLSELAYRNTALPIGLGQTISQPYVVALMSEALQLKPTDRVLEIGTGSGYAAAVLSRLAKEVYSVERLGELASEAQRALKLAGCENIHVLHADGTKGWPQFAPYDAISVTAGTSEVPEPLLNQLRPGGRMVMPLGKSNSQELICLTKHGDDEYSMDELVGVRFVPLVAADDKEAIQDG